MRDPLTAPIPDSGAPTPGAVARQGEATILPFPALFDGRPATPPPLTALERSRLRRLRVLAIESRLFPREEFWSGCARLLGDASPCPRAITALFFRSSADALRVRLAFYRPDAEAVSTDERWLLQLLAAIDQGDIGNVRALTAFRVHRRYRRAFAALATKVADALTALPT